MAIDGAPALFVDGERIYGALPEDQLWPVIDRALRAAGVEPPAARLSPPLPANSDRARILPQEPLLDAKKFQHRQICGNAYRRAGPWIYS